MSINTTQDYLNKLAELGVDAPDSQLRTQFREGGHIANHYEYALVDESATLRHLPPPLTEDFSHLNPRYTRNRSEQAKKAWAAMDDAKRARRIHLLSLIGREGGKARKFSAHLAHPTLYKKTS